MAHYSDRANEEVGRSTLPKLHTRGPRPLPAGPGPQLALPGGGR